MKIHRVDGNILIDWEKFHDFFAKTFEFPSYYGRNMDAWNDCMSDYCYSNGLVSLWAKYPELLPKQMEGEYVVNEQVYQDILAVLDKYAAIDS